MKEAAPKLASDSSQSIRELNIIIKISQSIISAFDYEKVLQIISDGMSELLDIETAAIYVLDNAEELYLAATTPPLNPNMPDTLRRITLSEHPHIHKTIITRQPQLLEDTHSAPLSPAEKNVVELRQLRSLLYFPFIQEDRVLGVLILGTIHKSRTYSAHDIDLGQTVANQLAIAIQNSRLHADLKNHRDNLEKTVAERTETLEELNEELKTINIDLHEKNELVINQKEEIEKTLNELRSMQAKLVQTEKMASLGILTAGVAHEINNPLNFMMGAYIGLDDFFTHIAPEHKEKVSILLKGLKTGIDRASDIVQGLNQFSRHNESYDEDCDLHSIIDNCLLMLYNKYKHEIRIKKSYCQDRLLVLGNNGKLHQAFTNILLNSIQAIESDGQISIITQVIKDYASVTILDTGIGISAENIPRITDPFYTTKGPNKGTGLGLSITYNIIQDHNGKFEVESEINRGTSIKITLPI